MSRGQSASVRGRQQLVRNKQQVKQQQQTKQQTTTDGYLK
jgi:DNA/RNA endonuclease YhcR with UshA esterase domain